MKQYCPNCETFGEVMLFVTTTWIMFHSLGQLTY